MSRKLSKKKQQGKTKTTYGKGKQSELTITSINPFTDASELDFPYLQGKVYPAPEASEVRASRPRQPDIELDKVNRITTRLRREKKESEGFNTGGMADYIKDLL